jgi:hypothetical protein
MILDIFIIVTPLSANPDTFPANHAKFIPSNTVNHTNPQPKVEVFTAHSPAIINNQ